MEKTGLSTKQLEERLKPKSQMRSPDDYSNIFKKYHAGKTAPRPKFVEEVEMFSAETRGLKWVFDHPLWEALRCNQYSLRKVHQLMSRIDGKVHRTLFVQPQKANSLERRPMMIGRQIHRLSSLNSLDSVAALLLLVRECELTEKPIACIEAKWEVTSAICRLAVFQPFQKIAQPLYDLIFEEFLMRNHPLPKEFQDLHSKYPLIYEGPSKRVNVLEVAANYAVIVAIARLRGLVSDDPHQQMSFLRRTQGWYRRQLPTYD